MTRIPMTILLAASVAACSAEKEPAPQDAEQEDVAEAESAEPATAEAAANPEADDPPGGGLSFEWSANGFRELPAEFAWSGDAGEYAGVTLAVPETDNFVWISKCDKGMVKTYFLPQPEALNVGDRTKLQFETDASSKTLSYPVTIAHLPFGDGADDPASRSPVLVQSPGDPMFAALKSGTWAYFQVGEGDDAAKLRISLKGAKKAWDAFLPSCKKAGA